MKYLVSLQVIKYHPSFFVFREVKVVVVAAEAAVGVVVVVVHEWETAGCSRHAGQSNLPRIVCRPIRLA